MFACVQVKNICGCAVTITHSPFQETTLENQMQKLFGCITESAGKKDNKEKAPQYAGLSNIQNDQRFVVVLRLR
jgi:hypothetical protein